MPRRSSTTDPSPHLSYAPPARDGLTLAQLGPRLRRGWAWILIPTLVVAIGAGVFVETVAPRYTADASIQLESRDPTLPIDEQTVARQVQKVLSRDLARDAVHQLNLVADAERAATVADVGPVRSLLMLVGLGRPALDMKPEDRALGAYYERLSVGTVGTSRALQVAFSAGDPELAAKAANTISELYVASLKAAKADTGRPVAAVPGADIDALRARVADAEAKVEAYRARTGPIGSGAAGSSPAGQKLGDLSNQLAQARTVQADLAGRVKLLKETIKEGRAFEIPDIASNDLLRRTVESRMTVRAQLALESRTLLPAHPRFKALTAQADDLDQQIKAAAERIVRTLENDVKIAAARVDSLQATVQGQSDVVAKGNSGETQLRALEREARSQREQLESQLARSRAASARNTESATAIDAHIVSRAVVPELPSFPQKIPVVGIAAALTFLLSAAAVLARRPRAMPERFERRTSVAEQEPALSERTEPAAEHIDYPEPLPPENHSEPHRFAAAYAGFGSVVTANATFPRLVAEDGSLRQPSVPEEAQIVEPAPAPRQAEPDALQALIDRLGTVASQGGRCVLVVETVGRAPGADGLAAGLARSLAARAPTLMVDVGAVTGNGGPGLTDVVAGQAAFLDVIHPVADARYHAVRAGSTDRAILLEEPHGLAIGLNAMAQAYDWVICRLSSADGSSDDLLSALSACMDSVVIASDAEPDDAGLVALYGLATDAGAGQVLVARDPAAAQTEPEMQLRLSA